MELASWMTIIARKKYVIIGFCIAVGVIEMKVEQSNG